MSAPGTPPGNYLGNLAARSLAPAPAVRPRLASRFEPLAPWTEPLTAAPALVEETREEVAAAPARPPERPRRPAAPREEPLQEEPPAPPRRRRARRAEAVEEVEGIETAAPEPVRPATPMAVPVVALPAQGRLDPRSVLPFEASPPGPLSTRVERGNVDEAREIVPAVRAVIRDGAQSAPFAPIAQEKLPLSTRVERGPGGEVSRASRPEGRQPTEHAAVPALLQPKVTLAEREPFPVRPQAPAPAPTIQVSIGRIEVRATPAPKAPARERSAAPAALSLEDYLKQRSRGERR